ncbi:Two-component response regulator [Bacillus thuringiensis serovar israelensis ATCC 35646]|nr:Two-component response regulator [Bacillus thuringiensis serovar israelensis ATCC 35646]
MAHETILVVDDEKEIRNLITIYLKNEGYKVLQAGDGEERLRLLEENEVALIVSIFIDAESRRVFLCVLKVRKSERDCLLLCFLAKRRIWIRI